MIEHVGICQLCGQHGNLTFEHFPPHKAFNNKPVFSVDFRKAISLPPNVRLEGQIHQKGIGNYTLCSTCNNKTGSWYGSQYVHWCRQGKLNIERYNTLKGFPNFDCIYPLAIIKQIIVMFFSLNNYPFSKIHSDLATFVLNKDQQNLPDQYDVFAYLNSEGTFRTSGVSGMLKYKEMFTFSEITFPPFGYVLTFNSKSPDSRLISIKHFSNHPYNESTNLEINFPILPTFLKLPGDYRTLREIENDYNKNCQV